MDIISTIVGSIFEIYIGHIFFSKFGKKRVSNKTYSICLLCISVFLTIASLLLVKKGLGFFSFATYAFIHCSLFKIKFYQNVILSLALMITSALSEMISVLGTTVGINVTIETIQTNDILHFSCVLLANFIALAIFKPIKTSSFSSIEKAPFWFSFGTAVLPFTSAFIIVLLYRFSFLVDDKSYRISTLIAAISLIIANILILFVIDKQEIHFRTIERLKFAESQIKNQAAHYSELYSQQEALKKFRHDSKNFYISLISILKNMSTDEAIKYIREKMQIEDDKDKTIDSGHPVIDSIIHTKNQQAKTHGFSIISNIKITNKILIDELELGVLIGNALDNAIEAVAKIESDKQKTIVINIISFGDMISIEVSNPTNNDVDAKNLATTKKDKKMHGYGLTGIEAITNKHHGNLSISYENDIFSVSCILVNEKNA